MPFFKTINIENGILGIWELTDSIEKLIEKFQFSETELIEFKKFTVEKRKKEYLTTRLLLQELLKEKKEIIYLQSGKPKIKGSNKNLSISHSANFVAIVISNEFVGIDVENVQRNIDRIFSRFLHKKEIEWIEKLEEKQFLKILFWCAKEAIFKCSIQSGVLFNTQIIIPRFEFKKTNCFNGNLIKENCDENYKLWYFYFQNNIVVYCVEVQNNYS